MLKSLVLDIAYRSDTSKVVTQFYVPCLEKSALYRRAAGYFTSNGLSLAAKGIAHLIENGGRIRLVASPYLTETDVAAITAGYQSRDEVLQAAATRDLQDAENELQRDRLAALAWLISVGALDIKLAFRVEPYSGQVQRGIYHEKIGIFTDAVGDSVAFTGSQNETAGGLIENFESIDVFCSWVDQQRVSRKINDFDALWNNKTSGLAVIDFTAIGEEILKKYKTTSPPDIDPEERPFVLHMPPHKAGSNLSKFRQVLQTPEIDLERAELWRGATRALIARYCDDEYGTGVDIRYFSDSSRYKGWEPKGIRLQQKDFSKLRTILSGWAMRVITLKQQFLAV